jgi:hypothetical protein
VDELVDHDTFAALAGGLRCNLLELDIPLVYVLYFVVELLDHFIRQLVRADGDAEVVR